LLLGTAEAEPTASAPRREAQEVDQRHLDTMRVARMIRVRDDPDIERLKERQEREKRPKTKLKA
jgi:hypothetical protein